MALNSREPVIVWLALIGLTLLSYGSWLDPTWADRRVSGSAVVVIAGVKAWLIATRYMELRRAPWPLRLIFNVWVVAVVAILIAMFWQA